MLNYFLGLQTPRALNALTGSSLLPILVAVAISIALGTFSTRALADSHGLGVDSDNQDAPYVDKGPDTDADGVFDKYDLDDDNDGILDSIEGVVDIDGDGLADRASVDTDFDGTPDVYDLDSDNDGILDNMEARLDRAAVEALDLVRNGSIDIVVAVGTNGIPDVIETSVDSNVLIYSISDKDKDGTPDFRDLDSDVTICS